MRGRGREIDRERERGREGEGEREKRREVVVIRGKVVESELFLFISNLFYVIS